MLEASGRTYRRFDKGGDAFYEQISALHKAVRGSSPDAALYWLARMLDGGCDPLYVARRLVRMASEDIGNADPRGLQLAIDAWDAFRRLGSPEGELALAQAVLYLASAPKSNKIEEAFLRAMAYVREEPVASGAATPAQRPHKADGRNGSRQGIPVRPCRGGRVCRRRAVLPRRDAGRSLLRADGPRPGGEDRRPAGALWKSGTGRREARKIRRAPALLRLCAGFTKATADAAGSTGCYAAVVVFRG